MHGRITPLVPGTTTIDVLHKPFVVELTDATGVVVFRSSLEAGALQQSGSTFAYINPGAIDAGGFASVKIHARGGGYIVTLRAYGDLSRAADHMTTHLFVDADEWTLAGHWIRTSNGWRLDLRNTFANS